jgi:hypothetical protein
MNKYERIISAIKERTSFLEMVEAGIKPEEIKRAIIELLEPYFDNRQTLEKAAMDCLVSDSVLLVRIRRDKFFFDKFEKCLATYRSAKSKNRENCFKSCAFFLNEIAESETKFWSVTNLEIDKYELELEDALHECLKNIGEIIEGLTKPFLKALLCQTRIDCGVSESGSNVKVLDLGQIVTELVKRSSCAELFAPPPWNISLNQWRNIAYHHSARVKNEKVVCWYGREHIIKQIELSRDEMVEVVRKIVNVHCVLKLAHTLFFVDNVEDIMKLTAFPEKGPREESELLSLTAGLASQGFEVVEVKKTIGEAKLIIRDVSDLDMDKRRAHASQFLFPLWLVTRSRKLTIEYREKNNTPNLLMSVDGETCERIYSGKLRALNLAKKVKMVSLK